MCRKSWDYYIRHLKENFINYDDELDPQRLQEIYRRARQDADYLTAKVGSLWCMCIAAMSTHASGLRW